MSSLESRVLFCTRISSIIWGTIDNINYKNNERFYNNTNVHELIINEDTNDITQTVKVDTIDQGEDTLTFLGNYIDQVDTELDKTKLKDFAKELYTEASE